MVTSGWIRFIAGQVTLGWPRFLPFSLQLTPWLTAQRRHDEIGQRVSIAETVTARPSPLTPLPEDSATALHSEGTFLPLDICHSKIALEHCALCSFSHLS